MVYKARFENVYAYKKKNMYKKSTSYSSYQRKVYTGKCPKLGHFWHVLGSTSPNFYPIFTVFSQNINRVYIKRTP